MNPQDQKLPKFALLLYHVSDTDLDASRSARSSPSRKRKLNDRSLPTSILSDPQLSVDSKMYQDLLEMEKKLDWTIMRKKAEVQDALGRTASVRTTFFLLDHVRETVSRRQPARYVFFCLILSLDKRGSLAKRQHRVPQTRRILRLAKAFLRGS